MFIRKVYAKNIYYLKNIINGKIFKDIFMEQFQELGLPQEILNSLTRIGFVNPTPIQAQTIPVALAGRDVIGCASTGTGKTAAFALPLIAKLLTDKKSTALILTPTRELAQQVCEFIKKIISNKISLRSALLIGGEPMPKQFRQLQNNPRLIIGTPGRVNDHLQRRSLSLKETSMLVLDEMDRMLDFGFGIQLDEIIQYLPAKRQTLMFSATLPVEIKKISESYLNNPLHIAVDSVIKPALNIDHQSLFIKESDKYPTLLRELDNRTGSIIVFVKTKRNAEKLSESLENDGHNVDYLHGGLKQSRRTKTIGAFYKKKYQILIATDVAARGLDIPHIEHVINYNLPQCPEDYIHRIGRTARAGASGAAICFISNAERNLWRAIQPMIDPDAKPMPPQQKEYSSQRSNSFSNKRMKYASNRDERVKDRHERPSSKRRDNADSSWSKRPAFDNAKNPRFNKEPRDFSYKKMSERPSRAGGDSFFQTDRKSADRSYTSRSPVKRFSEKREGSEQNWSKKSFDSKLKRDSSKSRVRDTNALPTRSSKRKGASLFERAPDSYRPKLFTGSGEDTLKAKRFGDKNATKRGTKSSKPNRPSFGR